MVLADILSIETSVPTLHLFSAHSLSLVHISPNKYVTAGHFQAEDRALRLDRSFASAKQLLIVLLAEAKVVGKN